jgi:copper oxidase (laccase) domain-containing protein
VLGAEGVTAAIGPCISAEHFEVGPEVAEAFARAGLGDTVREQPGARPHVDLRAAVEQQLRGRDVLRIDTSDRCTYRDAEEFYSYRRDVTHAGRGHTGRLGALIGVREA